jgi:5-methylthioribose kinase
MSVYLIANEPGNFVFYSEETICLIALGYFSTNKHLQSKQIGGQELVIVENDGHHC